nr:low molecular weight protein-tyrosine-phosphatase [Sphingosinicella soli]
MNNAPSKPGIKHLGNICRSPLAEGAMRRLVEAQGAPIAIDSAGTGDWHIGRAPDPRAQAEALRQGLDISMLRARQVTEEDFHRFDHIVAMDAKNLADLLELRPDGAGAALSLLLDHAEGGDVPDPYYGGDEGFAETFRLVEAGARGLLQAMSGQRATTL